MIGERASDVPGRAEIIICSDFSFDGAILKFKPVQDFSGE